MTKLFLNQVFSFLTKDRLNFNLRYPMYCFGLCLLKRRDFEVFWAAHSDIYQRIEQFCFFVGLRDWDSLDIIWLQLRCHLDS